MSRTNWDTELQLLSRYSALIRGQEGLRLSHELKTHLLLQFENELQAFIQKLGKTSQEVRDNVTSLLQDGMRLYKSLPKACSRSRSFQKVTVQEDHILKMKDKITIIIQFGLYALGRKDVVGELTFTRAQDFKGEKCQNVSSYETGEALLILLIFFKIFPKFATKTTELLKSDSTQFENRKELINRKYEILKRNSDMTPDSLGQVHIRVAFEHLDELKQVLKTINKSYLEGINASKRYMEFVKEYYDEIRAYGVHSNVWIHFAKLLNEDLENHVRPWMQELQKGYSSHKKEAKIVHLQQQEIMISKEINGQMDEANKEFMKYAAKKNLEGQLTREKETKENNKEKASDKKQDKDKTHHEKQRYVLPEKTKLRTIDEAEKHQIPVDKIEALIDEFNTTNNFVKPSASKGKRKRGKAGFKKLRYLDVEKIVLKCNKYRWFFSQEAKDTKTMCLLFEKIENREKAYF